MTSKSILLTGLLVAPLAVVAAEGPPPPARKIPGITAEDRFPNGCVDCHLNYVDMKMDTRFGTLLKQWGEKVEPALLAKAQAVAPEGVTFKGKHPQAVGSLASVPGKCLACHGKSSKMAPPFAGMIHAIHLTGGEKNPFLTVFQGECTHCHKIDPVTGRSSLPGAPER